MAPVERVWPCSWREATMSECSNSLCACDEEMMMSLSTGALRSHTRNDVGFRSSCELRAHDGGGGRSVRGARATARGAGLEGEFFEDAPCAHGFQGRNIALDAHTCSSSSGASGVSTKARQRAGICRLLCRRCAARHGCGRMEGCGRARRHDDRQLRHCLRRYGVVCDAAWQVHVCQSVQHCTKLSAPRHRRGQ